MRRHPPVSIPRNLEAFAVDPDAVQVAWRGLPAGPIEFSCADTSVTAEGDGGPGAVTLNGLPHSSALTVRVVPSGGDARELDITTLAPPPGERLTRFATMSDLHLGSTKFGMILKAREETGAAIPHPMRCALAAGTEAQQWGAERLVLKGDLTHHTRAEEWPQLEELVGGFKVPYSFTLGNHDRQPKKKGIDTEKGMANAGLDFRPVTSVDLPGIRIVVADTSIPNKGHGRTTEIIDEVCELLRETDQPVFLGIHHHFEQFVLPWFWPPGIPVTEGVQFLRAIREANPRLMVSTGHTHRNRAYFRKGVLVTEVASPKDFPGVWGGYTVHEGGITQTVRRVAEPSAIAWTDRTRKAVGGIWSMWAPGYLDQRCFSHHWTD